METVNSMNDLPLYHETFEALEVHERDREFANTAKSLFDAAHHAVEWNGALFEHLHGTLDSPQASQLFLQNSSGEGRYFDKLSLHALPKAVIVGIQHHDAKVRNDGYNSSMVLENGSARAYYADISNYRIDAGSSEWQAIEDFKNRFYAVTAAMSLFGRIKRLDTHEAVQNESVAATFAKAA